MRDLVVRNETSSVVSLEYVNGNIYIVGDMDFVATSVDSLVANVDELFLMKHYVQLVPKSKHVDWMIEILVFDRVM